MQHTPSITIIHELPGRLRMSVSQSLQDPGRMERSVSGHAGIVSVKYTPVTRSILVIFEPQEVAREEIIVRVGLSLAIDYGALPVHIFSEPKKQEMSDSAFYSGFLLAIALIYRVIHRNSNSGNWLERAAGFGTSWAVLDHGLLEVKERGNFDPEVLSVVYLLTALLRGNFLPAAIFTWMTTFGRHLVHIPSPGVELRPVEFTDGNAENPSYEVVINPISNTSDKRTLLRLLPAVIKYATTGKGEAGRGSLVDEIHKVSKIHGEVLEGLGGFRSGIPLKIR